MVKLVPATLSHSVDRFRRSSKTAEQHARWLLVRTLTSYDSTPGIFNPRWSNALAVAWRPFGVRIMSPC